MGSEVVEFGAAQERRLIAIKGVVTILIDGDRLCRPIRRRSIQLGSFGARRSNPWRVLAQNALRSWVAPSFSFITAF